ncbi:hypothetical protein DVA86_27205 [Streptomyces armeniacus]|uniref:Vegetative cell wall protein gp1 n=1 Tax=Streptomyces armeniacus TaxID=83291 RepID=A0A345XVV3_9ACTN|nr:hypothetical protein [Streptomyces armeniacus]AXK35769.1 hypothetical protein DVA86_27205 [Streptomyces armeniacus]
MGGLLTELGKQIAERWLSLLVLPGALLLTVLAAGHELGHRRWYDIAVLPGRLGAYTDQWAGTSSRLVALLAGVLVASAACGVCAQALGSLLERGWLAAGWQGWPAPVRRLAERRTERRRARYAGRRDAVARAAAEHGPGTRAVQAARHRLRRVAQVAPDRPTWAGDRLHATETRLRRDLGVDVGMVWPQLWLAASDTTRAEVTAAREAMARAATLAGWGLLYLLVAAAWWPGLLVSAAVTATAWHRARAATDTYATLVEAVTRFHFPDLARQLGLLAEGSPPSRRTGELVTEYAASGRLPSDEP